MNVQLNPVGQRIQQACSLVLMPRFPIPEAPDTKTRLSPLTAQNNISVSEHVVGTAIGALCLTRFFYWKINPGVGIPQTHAIHRAV